MARSKPSATYFERRVKEMLEARFEELGNELNRVYPSSAPNRPVKYTTDELRELGAAGKLRMVVDRPCFKDDGRSYYLYSVDDELEVQVYMAQCERNVKNADIHMSWYHNRFKHFDKELREALDAFHFSDHKDILETLGHIGKNITLDSIVSLPKD